jgi:hypothetical protein
MSCMELAKWHMWYTCGHINACTGCKARSAAGHEGEPLHARGGQRRRLQCLRGRRQRPQQCVAAQAATHCQCRQGHTAQACLKCAPQLTLALADDSCDVLQPCPLLIRFSLMLMHTHSCANVPTILWLLRAIGHVANAFELMLHAGSSNLVAAVRRAGTGRDRGVAGGRVHFIASTYAADQARCQPLECTHARASHHCTARCATYL